MALQEEFEKQGNWLFRYRSFLPLIILFVGMGLYVWSKVDAERSIIEQEPYRIYYETLALLVSLFGLVIRIYTVGHTPLNTSGRNTAQGQVADSLNTTGIYSLVRHPLYVGNFLMWLGPTMLIGNFWFIVTFVLFYWLYYERIMFAEEQFLRNKYGAQYVEWSQRVPAFVPNLKRFIRPCLPFSWKKVLRKEKNGLFALFLIFCVFDISGKLIESTTDFNYFLIIMCLLTGISYLVLKLLKMSTNLLNDPSR